ncbi:MAG: hypothetical protein IPK79_01285 [Vampirovibrionales bacterium]|nr:hypothetical protein [Vampirovibrionales bacterium]MBK8189069.1 hypothetical protein [Vampirovibrionales bacterium]
MMGGTPKAPKAPPPVPVVDDTAANEARRLEEKRNRLAAGRSSTLVTGGFGLVNPAPTAPKVLLGQ